MGPEHVLSNKGRHHNEKPVHCNEDPAQPKRSKQNKLLLKSHFCVSVALWLFLNLFFGRITACSILAPPLECPTLGPCNGRAESQPRDHLESPCFTASWIFWSLGFCPHLCFKSCWRLGFLDPQDSAFHQWSGPVRGLFVCHSRPISCRSLQELQLHVLCLCYILPNVF